LGLLDYGLGLTVKVLKVKGVGCRVCGLESRDLESGFVACRGTSPIERRPPPWVPPRTLGIGLQQGPGGVVFL